LETNKNFYLQLLLFTYLFKLAKKSDSQLIRPVLSGQIGLLAGLRCASGTGCVGAKETANAGQSCGAFV